MKRLNHLFVKTHTEFPPELGLMSIRDILTKNKASLQKAEATPSLLTGHGPCKHEHSLLISSLSRVTHFDLCHTQAFSLLVLARGHLPSRRAPRDHKLPCPACFPQARHGAPSGRCCRQPQHSWHTLLFPAGTQSQVDAGRN